MAGARALVRGRLIRNQRPAHGDIVGDIMSRLRRGDPACEYCGGEGYIEHLPLHPDDRTVMTSPCECLGSDSDEDMTPGDR